MNKLYEQFLAGISEAKAKRISMNEARKILHTLTPLLKKTSKRFELAGSLRRKRPTAKDLDILVANGNLKEIRKGIEELFDIVHVIREGKSLVSVLVGQDASLVQVEVINTTSDIFGAALLHLTGSSEFNTGMRIYAKQKGYTLSQHGIFAGEKKVAGKTEKDIFTLLGLKIIPPEKREDFWIQKDKYKL